MIVVAFKKEVVRISLLGHMHQFDFFSVACEEEMNAVLGYDSVL